MDSGAVLRSGVTGSGMVDSTGPCPVSAAVYVRTLAVVGGRGGGGEGTAW